MMQPAARGALTLSLGGINYSLCPSFAALALLEEASGYGLITLAKRFAEGAFTLRDLAALIKAGLEGAGHTAPPELEDYIAQAGIATLAPIAMRFLEIALGGDPSVGKA